MQNQPLDLVALVIALLAFIVSKDAAMTVGPYAAIVILACAGATLSLSGIEEQMGIMKSAVFITIRVIVAISATVFIAELVQWAVPRLEPRYTLSPIAFGIGWIKDYNHVREVVGGMFQRVLSKKIDDGK